MEVYEKSEYRFLRNLLQGCKACELCKLDINKKDKECLDKGKVLCSGYSKAKIFFIGESPFCKREVGKDGIIRPFNFGSPSENKVGSGQILFSILKELGVEREDIYITNLIKCSYNDELKPNINEYFEACYPLLKLEIELIKPKIIFLLGNLVTEFMKMKMGVDNENVFSIWHPAYIYRNRSMLDTYKKKIKKCFVKHESNRILH